jgi:dihydroorotate dehydrogenase electron transfer subunit
MWLDCPEITSTARPGQFVMVHCGPDTILRRPISIHQVDGNRLALLYVVIGKGTAQLSGMKQGEQVSLLGPLGNGFTIPEETANLLLVAGGMGIAPLCFLAESAARLGHEVRILYGTASRDRCDVPANCEICPVTEDGSVGEQGLVTDLIAEHIGWADGVYACGPPVMYHHMQGRPELFAGKPVQVSLEERMGCGFGVCFGCTVKTRQGPRQVCRDGPVFGLDDIIW